MASNGTGSHPDCPALGETVEFSEPNRAFGGFLFILTTVTTPILTLWWWKRRDHGMLRKRSLRFALFTALGSHFVSLGVAWVNWVGQDALPCDVHVWIVFLLFPLIGAPLLARVRQFYNSAKYSQFLAERTRASDYKGYLINRGGVSGRQAIFKTMLKRATNCCRKPRHVKDENPSRPPSLSSESLDTEYIALMTKTKFSFTFATMFCFLFLGVLCVILKVIPADSPYFKGCYSCKMSETDFHLISALVISLVIPCLYSMWGIRNTPDPLHISKELGIALALSMIAVVLNIVTALDPGQLREKGEFDYFYLTELAIFAIVFVVMLYPILLTYDSSKVDVEPKSFDEVLADVTLKNLFYNYLAEEFSVENIIFYDAVETYTKKYEERSDEEVETAADLLLKTFILETAMLQVNLSHAERQHIVSAFKNSTELKTRVPQELFNNASAEICRVMSTDSFPRFLRSSIYKNRIETPTKHAMSIYSSIGTSFA